MVSLATGNSILANGPITAKLFNDQYYSGDVLQKSNGGDRDHDIYIYPVPILNANVAPLVDGRPVLLKEFVRNRRFTGDSMSSRFKENNSAISRIIFYDYPDVVKAFGLWRLPVDMFKGLYYPEDVATAPLIDPNGSVKDAYITVAAHEYAHVTQFVSGVVNYVPAEGMAVAMEMNYRLHNGVILSFRAGVYVQHFLVPLYRGYYNPMFSGTGAAVAIGVVTYGAGLFWNYFTEQYDFNNQLIRRCYDLQTAQNITDAHDQNGLIQEYETNPTGLSLALDQALGELYNKNLKDAFTDFSISAVLLRNNTSIPDQYKTKFPYFIYSSEYSDISTTYNNIHELAYWWEVLQIDFPMIFTDPDYTKKFPFTFGDSMVPTLTGPYETSAWDMTMLAFSILPQTTSIDIEVLAGEWRITLMQFTSDDTAAGEFIIDGPTAIDSSGTLSFDIGSYGFSPYAPIRLVCTHVSITDQGILENHSGAIPDSGYIIINPNIPPLAARNNGKHQVRNAAHEAFEKRTGINGKAKLTQTSRLQVKSVANLSKTVGERIKQLLPDKKDDTQEQSQ